MIDCSIIIPNLHSPIIDKTIDSVLNQETYHNFEVIVVGMDKFDLVIQHPEVRFIETDHPVSAGRARNIGIQEAKGEKLLFIDSDCIAKPKWIDTFFDKSNKSWKVIGGSVQTPTNNFWQMVYNLSMFHEQLTSQKRGEHSYLATLNLAIDRDVIDRVGLLNESLIRGQDIEWTSRMTMAGYDLLFEPNAVVVHLPPRHNFEALKNDYYKSGYYMINVRYQYPEIFHMPAILNSAKVWRNLKPLIAGFITTRIVLRSKLVRQHPKVIPYIYKLKSAWCEGARDRLKGNSYDKDDN